MSEKVLSKEQVADVKAFAVLNSDAFKLCGSHEALRAERDAAEYEWRQSDAVCTKLTAERDALKQSEEMSFGCFNMVAETLTAHGFPCSLNTTPPMMLNDAVSAALHKVKSERDAALAEVERMRPVVEAACDEEEDTFVRNDDESFTVRADYCERLMESLDTLRASAQKEGRP